MPERYDDKKQLLQNRVPAKHDNDRGNIVHELTEQLTELQKANKDIQQARRAALNLMEDAILSREALRKSQQELAQELKDTKKLQEISTKLIVENNVVSLYQALLDAATDIMEADCATIQLLIPEKNELYLLAQKGIHPESAKHFEYVGTDTLSSCTQALLLGERVIINDIQSHSDMLSTEDAEAYRLSDIVAMQSTPLITRGGTRVGMITTHWKQVHEPAERQLSLFDVLTRQAADLIERKQAEDVIQQVLHDTQLLRDLGARLLTEENIDVFYQDILEAAIKLTDADAGTIQLYDKTTKQLRLTTIIGLGKDVTDHFECVDASSNTSCGLALLKNERVFIDFDVPPSEDPDGSLKIHVDAGFYSAQSTPLTSRSDQPIGMLNTHFRKHHRPTEHQLRFVDLLARQTSDLIEQRQAAEALRKSEESFRVITKAAMALAWICSAPDGANIFFNDQWYEYTGQTKEQAAGYGWTNAVHPDDWKSIGPYWQRCQQTGEVYEGEVRYRRFDGAYRWFAFRALPRRNADNSIEAWYGLSFEIDDKKRAEDALRKSEEYLRQATEAANIYSWEFDFATQVTRMSENTERVIGRKPYENFEENLMLTHPDDRETAAKAFEVALNNGTDLFNYTVRSIAVPEDVRWINVSGKILRDTN